MGPARGAPVAHERVGPAKGGGGTGGTPAPRLRRPGMVGGEEALPLLCRPLRCMPLRCMLACAGTHGRVCDVRLLSGCPASPALRKGPQEALHTAFACRRAHPAQLCLRERNPCHPIGPEHTGCCYPQFLNGLDERLRGASSIEIRSCECRVAGAAHKPLVHSAGDGAVWDAFVDQPVHIGGAAWSRGQGGKRARGQEGS